MRCFCYDPLQLESGPCCAIRVDNRHSVYSHWHYRDNYRQALSKQHEVAESRLDTINAIQRQQKEVAALDAKYTPPRSLPMPDLRMIVFVLMSPLVVASCASKAPVVCPKPPLVPAWAMEAPSRSVEKLDQLFSISVQE